MAGKRFTLTFDDNIIDNLTGITHNVHSGYDVAMDLSGLLNNLHEENQHLREVLKKEYMSMSGNLCDACKHEEKDNTNNWFVGIDYDVKCNKGHEILLDDEEQKCEDFKLRLEDL